MGENEDRVATGVGPESSGYGVLALMSGAVGAERAESGGVGTALGREVAAEAEHVRPGGQAQAAESVKLAQADAFGDEAAGVLADREVGERVGG